MILSRRFFSGLESPSAAARFLLLSLLLDFDI